MAYGQHFAFGATDDPSAGGRLRAELKQWLIGAGINGVLGDEVTSAVTEAFNNAIEHPVDRTSGEVAVEGGIDGRELVVRVRDQGRWRETADPSRGRYGYKLMEAQMDSVDVERAGAGTVVTLRRTI